MTKSELISTLAEMHGQGKHSMRLFIQEGKVKGVTASKFGEVRHSYLFEPWLIKEMEAWRNEHN